MPRGKRGIGLAGPPAPRKWRIRLPRAPPAAASFPRHRRSRRPLRAV